MTIYWNVSTEYEEHARDSIEEIAKDIQENCDAVLGLDNCKINEYKFFFVNENARTYCYYTYKDGEMFKDGTKLSDSSVEDPEAFYKNTIRLSNVNVTDINSADGVSFEIYYANKSDKPIKYLTFGVRPYNAVGDVVSCEIRRNSDFYGQITGPIEDLKSIEDVKNAEDTCYLFSYDTKHIHPLATNENGIGYDGNVGFYYSDINSGQAKYVHITENDVPNILHCAYFENAWYNNTIKNIEVFEVEIEYMDGSKLKIPQDAMDYIKW